MKELIINIRASIDCFGAYSENCDGIYAAGDTVEACKKDVETAICKMREELPPEHLPKPIQGDFRITWHYEDSAKIRLAYMEREEKQRKAKAIRPNSSNDIPLERRMLYILHNYQRMQDENDRLREENVALKTKYCKASLRFDIESRHSSEKKKMQRQQLDDLMKRYLEKKRQIKELEACVEELKKQLHCEKEKRDEIMHKRSILASIDDNGDDVSAQ